MSETLLTVIGGLSWVVILTTLIVVHHRRGAAARRRHPAGRGRRDHFDQAVRMGNSGARCSCGRRRPDREAMHHTTTRCQPRREAA